MLDNIEDDSPMENELETLKQRANLMGIQYHPNIGVVKLREKVNATLNDIPDTEDDSSEKEKSAPAQKQADTTKVLSVEETKRLYHSRLRREANKLVRVRVTCMNPNKKNWTGEILSVSNAVIGTVKKFIPFNNEAGYHVPAVLLTLLKERQYQHFSQVKKPNGQKIAVAKLLPEFAIEVLNPLTKDELDNLKQRQLANHSIG
jgi:hypothetical protein